MARGMFTALQAALAGISGGATGYAKYQQQEQERKRQMKEEERAALRDALLQSQFGLQEQEFKAKFGPEALKRQDQERKDALATQLKAAQISASAAAQRDAAEAARKTKEQSEMGLAWYTKTMSDPNVPQATKNALGLRITEAQQRAGGRLRPEDVGSIASQYMGAEITERKLAAEEERSGGPGSGYSRTAKPATQAGGANQTAMAGGSYGSISTKQQITRREYDALKSQGYSDAQLSARYEVIG